MKNNIEKPNAFAFKAKIGESQEVRLCICIRENDKWLEDDYVCYVFEKQNIIICFLRADDFYELIIGGESELGCGT